MQVAQYLSDEATTAAIAKLLRRAIERLALLGDRPWATAAGGNLADAMLAHQEELQQAAFQAALIR
jgi:hypothetical protein